LHIRSVVGTKRSAESHWRASQFLFGFGAVSAPGPTSWQIFGRDVAFPLLQANFESVLLKVGRVIPRHGCSLVQTWSMSEQQEDLVRSLRLTCQDGGKMMHGRLSVVDGLQQCAYWLAQTSLLTSLLEQVWPQVTDGAVSVSVCFFMERYLFGLGALDGEIRRRSWTGCRRWETFRRMRCARLRLHGFDTCCSPSAREAMPAEC